MVREFCLEERRKQHQRLRNGPDPPQLPQDDDGDDDTFCIAWFHPDGIASKKLPVNGDDRYRNDYDDIYDSEERHAPSTTRGLAVDGVDHRAITSGDEASLMGFGQVTSGNIGRLTTNKNQDRQGGGDFAPSGGQAYSGSGDETKAKQGRKRPSQRVGNLQVGAGAAVEPASREKSSDTVSCLYQWNGYSMPMEVLQPFGYAPSLVQRLLEHATARIRQLDQAKEQLMDPKSTALGQSFKTQLSIQSSASSAGGYGEKAQVPTYPSSRSFAVRGATYARPEGYCLCWDNDLLLPALSERGLESSTRAPVRQQEWEEIRRKRNRRRHELQREVLPVVLWSTRQCDTIDASSLQLQSTLPPAGILQPCVQFLNRDSSHAVRMFTPPFEKGPISTPITVSCVAIATEDACFFSGLRKRFEFGHLYPKTNSDCLIERSPICLCADYEEGTIERRMTNGAGDGDSYLGRTTSGILHSDDSSCADLSLGAMTGDPGFKCSCPLSGLGEMGDDGEGGSTTGDFSDDDHFGQICRGRLGPGVWHCYVAVFDGEKSLIRMDGVPEPTTWETMDPLLPECKTWLDGLTIGSDHSFDMSLCFGNGSDGEGEGAMAELAVFKGQLDLADLEAVESHLMKKHGIPHPHRDVDEVAVDDNFSRKARALLAQSFATDVPVAHAYREESTLSSFSNRGLPDDRGVPLRYMTKLRQVAWKQISPVTGAAIVVPRIGARQAPSDSEW